MRNYKQLLEAVHNYKRTDEAFAFKGAVDKDSKRPTGTHTDPDTGMKMTVHRQGGVTHTKMSGAGAGTSYHTSGHVDGEPFHHASFSSKPEKSTRQIAATHPHLSPEQHKKILTMHNAHHFSS